MRPTSARHQTLAQSAAAGLAKALKTSQSPDKTRADALPLVAINLGLLRARQILIGSETTKSALQPGEMQPEEMRPDALLMPLAAEAGLSQNRQAAQALEGEGLMTSAPRATWLMWEGPRCAHPAKIRASAGGALAAAPPMGCTPCSPGCLLSCKELTLLKPCSWN